MMTSPSINPFVHVAPHVAASLSRWWALETLLATLLPRGGRAEPVGQASIGVVVLPFLSSVLRPR